MAVGTRMLLRSRGCLCAALNMPSLYHTIAGTQKGHQHKHFIGIALPYWASLQGGGFIWDIPILIFALLMCFLGP